MNLKKIKEIKTIKTKQLEQEQNQRNGHHIEVFQWGPGREECGGRYREEAA